MTHFTMTLGILENVDKIAAVGAGSSTIVDAVNKGEGGFELTVHTAQATTLIATVVSFSKVLERSVPVFLIPTNTYAATLTIFKVGLDIERKGDFDWADVISIAGNIAGIGLGMAVLASSAPVGTLLTLGVLASAVSTVNSDAIKGVGNYLVGLWNAYFKDNPSADYSSMSADPAGSLSLDEDLAFDFHSESLAIGIKEGGTIELGGISVNSVYNGSYTQQGGNFSGMSSDIEIENSGQTGSQQEGGSVPGETEQTESNDSTASSESGSFGLLGDASSSEYAVLYQSPGQTVDAGAKLPDARVYVLDPITVLPGAGFSGACREDYVHWLVCD